MSQGVPWNSKTNLQTQPFLSAKRQEQAEATAEYVACKGGSSRTPTIFGVPLDKPTGTRQKARKPTLKNFIPNGIVTWTSDPRLVGIHRVTNGKQPLLATQALRNPHGTGGGSTVPGRYLSSEPRCSGLQVEHGLSRSKHNPKTKVSPEWSLLDSGNQPGPLLGWGWHKQLFLCWHPFQNGSTKRKASVRCSLEHPHCTGPQVGKPRCPTSQSLP